MQHKIAIIGLGYVGKAKELLSYKGEILLKEGLKKTLPYYKQNKTSINIETN
jgi:nucleoside-diphosphate-sugar epimerase